MNLQGCHRRGGYQPPARYKPTITNQLGRIRTMSDVVPFNRTLLTRNKSGRLRASPTMGTNCMPFNQARGSVTLRAAGSRPYGGWAIASAWYAETLPGTAQESRMTHMSVRHCPRALPAKLQFTDFFNDLNTTILPDISRYFNSQIRTGNSSPILLQYAWESGKIS